MSMISARTLDEMEKLRDEAAKRALEISELEQEDDFELKFVLSVLFLPIPGTDRAAKTHARKMTRIDFFRQWLKLNNVTPRDCGIGQGFVNKYLPEYSFQY